MVAAPWGWDIAFLMVNFGWKAVIGVVIANILYYIISKNEFANLVTLVNLLIPMLLSSGKTVKIQSQVGSQSLTCSSWPGLSTNAHYPPLFIGGFLFFIGFTMASKAYQNKLEIKGPLLVGFFLAGLVTHGGFRLGGLHRCYRA